MKYILVLSSVPELKFYDGDKSRADQHWEASITREEWNKKMRIQF